MVADALPNPLAYKQRRRLSNFGRQLLRSSTANELVPDTHPDPPSTIDLQDLRDSVRSLWRKRQPGERLKIVAFAIPNDEELPSNYRVLPTGDYHELVASFATADSQCVFYELEDASAPPTPVGGCPPSAVFNEYIVVSRQRDSFDQCTIRLNSPLHV